MRKVRWRIIILLLISVVAVILGWPQISTSDLFHPAPTPRYIPPTEPALSYIPTQSSPNERWILLSFDPDGKAYFALDGHFNDARVWAVPVTKETVGPITYSENIQKADVFVRHGNDLMPLRPGISTYQIIVKKGDK